MCTQAIYLLSLCAYTAQKSMRSLLENFANKSCKKVSHLSPVEFYNIIKIFLSPTPREQSEQYFALTNTIRVFVQCVRRAFSTLPLQTLVSLRCLSLAFCAQVYGPCRLKSIFELLLSDKHTQTHVVPCPTVCVFDCLCVCVSVSVHNFCRSSHHTMSLTK